MFLILFLPLSSFPIPCLLKSIENVIYNVRIFPFNWTGVWFLLLDAFYGSKIYIQTRCYCHVSSIICSLDSCRFCAGIFIMFTECFRLPCIHTSDDTKHISFFFFSLSLFYMAAWCLSWQHPPVTVLIMHKIIRFQMIGSHKYPFSLSLPPLFSYLTVSNKFKVLNLIYTYWFTMTNHESFFGMKKFKYLHL